MKVKDLMDILKKVHPENKISVFWDGAARGDVEAVYSRNNETVIVGEIAAFDTDMDKKDSVILYPIDNKSDV